MAAFRWLAPSIDRAALCSYPLLQLYSRMVDRWSEDHAFAGSALVVAFSLLGFWWLFGLGQRWVSIVFYLWIAVVGILLVSQFWCYASHRLDARQARRLFGFVGAGRLQDPDPRMRAAALSYLAGLSDPASNSAAFETLAEMLGDGDREVRAEAANALSDIDEPQGQAELVRLLYDREPRVVRRAIDAVMRRAERGSSSPLYVPILVSNMRHRKLKHDARDALVAFGESAIPALKHFMNDPQEDIWVRRALPKTIARIAGPSALLALTESLSAPDPFLRRKVIESLGTLRQRDSQLQAPVTAVETQVGAESRGYLRALIDLESLRRNSWCCRAVRRFSPEHPAGFRGRNRRTRAPSGHPPSGCSR